MFDTQVSLNRSPCNDEEFVERARRIVARHARSRLALRIFAVAVLLCTIGLVVYAQHVINNLNNLIPGVQQGVRVGALMGFVLAVTCAHAVHLLVIAFFFPDVRALRLLLRYHDALEELRRSSESRFSENGVVAGIRSSTRIGA